MKIKYLVAASAVSLFAGSLAQAADIIYSPTEPVAVSATLPTEIFSWDGIYAGVNGGAAWAHNRFKSNTDGSKWLVKPQGYVGGAYVGYNYDLSNDLVAGVESDFAWSNIEADQEIANNKYTTTQKWVGSTRIRVGYAFDSFLPYVASGLSYGQVDVRVQGTNPKGGFIHKDNVRFGWTSGAGIDYVLTDNILFRAEYKYSNYLEKEVSVDNSATTNLKHIFNAGDIQLGVAYKF